MSMWKQIGLWVLGFFGVLIILIVGGFLVQGSDFIGYRFFAPRREAVRRQVFEESKAYNQGMIQELQDMHFQYVQATPDQQLALRSIILHRVVDYPDDRLPPDLRSFIAQLRLPKGVTP